MQLIQLRSAEVAGVDQATAMLSPAEQIRLQAMRHPQRQREFIYGRWLARLGVAQVTGSPAASVQFQLSRHGRPDPVHPGPTQVWSSIAHSAGQVAVAVAPYPVGLDLERLDRRMPSPGTQRRVLSAAELEQLAATPAADRNALFLRWWAVKEAVVKHDGTGVGRRMQGTSCVDLGPDSSSAALVTPAGPRQVQLASTGSSSQPLVLALALSATGANPARTLVWLLDTTSLAAS